MHRTRLFMMVLALSALIGMSGCWNDMEEWSGGAVWSDDDRGIVGIYEYFEGQNTVTHLKKRKIESELYIMPYGEVRGEPRRIAMRSSGRINDLFFMRSADYLIVNREERLNDLDEGRNLMSHFYIDKVSLDGTITSLGARQALTMISCDAEGNSATTTGHVISAFPSPDAQIIARVETETTCQEQTVTMIFLDSGSLEQLGEPFIISHPIGEHLGITDYAWLDNGRFAQVTTSFQGPSGMSYASNTLPESIAGLSYDCFFPATNSGDTNADGVYVSVTDGQVNLSSPNPAANIFGCPNP